MDANKVVVVARFFKIRQHVRWNCSIQLEGDFNNYDQTRKCEIQNKVYTKLAPENTLTSAITK